MLNVDYCFASLLAPVPSQIIKAELRRIKVFLRGT
jgi:hypothetical protein